MPKLYIGINSHRPEVLVLLVHHHSVVLFGAAAINTSEEDVEMEPAIVAPRINGLAVLLTLFQIQKALITQWI